MAEDTVRQECDERTGEYRENEEGEDRDPLHLSKLVLKLKAFSDVDSRRNRTRITVDFN